MDLRVTTFGDGSQRALLLHGISSNAEGWWRVGPFLAELGYSVTAPDLRGHGETGPADRYGLTDHAEDVRALGDGWDLVVGHSMGGAIAAKLATPAFCTRLILIDPALVVPGGAQTLEWMTRAYRPPVSVESVSAANPRWHPEDARIKAEALLQSSASMVEQTLADNPDWNVMAEVLALQVPTLLIGADPAHGGLVPPGVGASIADQVATVEFRLIEGAGHSMHRDEFDVMAAVVAEWLAS